MESGEWRNADDGRKPGRGGSNAGIDSVGRRRARGPVGPRPGTLRALGAATGPHGTTAPGRRRGRGGRAARIRAAAGLFSLGKFQDSSETLASKAIWSLSTAHRTP